MFHSHESTLEKIHTQKQCSPGHGYDRLQAISPWPLMDQSKLLAICRPPSFPSNRCGIPSMTASATTHLQMTYGLPCIALYYSLFLEPSMLLDHLRLLK